MGPSCVEANGGPSAAGYSTAAICSSVRHDRRDRHAGHGVTVATQRRAVTGRGRDLQDTVLLLYAVVVVVIAVSIHRDRHAGHGVTVATLAGLYSADETAVL
jgi:hypothetical protein